MEWGVAIAVILAGALAIGQIYRDPAYTPEIRKRSLRALLLFTAYILAGAVFLIALPLERLTVTGLAFLLPAILAWVGLGGLWILRTTPSKRPPPDWVLRSWTWLDWGLIGLFGIGCLGTVLTLYTA
ncbi:MAG: hypothetical protein KDJ19_08835 [Hyphomicrobiaceae bacterium]|nr:hypothetical protein [Hyphomicrobiaceae bacterium]MCC0024053.1 hypothetical protein [Hyphomicrobiaceae bacterium]